MRAHARVDVCMHMCLGVCTRMQAYARGLILSVQPLECSMCRIGQGCHAKAGIPFGIREPRLSAKPAASIMGTDQTDAEGALAEPKPPDWLSASR